MCDVFFYIGTIITIVVWISSYAVLSKAYSKEKATIFQSIINIIIAILRIFSFLIPFTVHQKLKYSLIGIIATCSITLDFIGADHVSFALYFFSFIIGIFAASIYGSLFVVSGEYGYVLSDFELNRITTSAAFG